MNNRDSLAHSNNKFNSSTTVILILFILLVIVVQTFSAKPSSCGADSSADDVSSITGTKGFNVFNNSPYRLELISSSRPDRNPPTLIIPPGEFHHYELPCDSSISVEYYAYSEDNRYWGNVNIEFFAGFICFNYGIRRADASGVLRVQTKAYIAVYVY
ncbi:hypothetical protein [Paenibacillus herberti]|uniref:Uncharacterized protein n=1 Tax=Paenibacillus herberti TaxID=1619309 RepID=A0A229NV55_9BACL|nr:hypothetical protein [Paenibacillus herberti]OXM13768.1 hypothetical protein CGZ75_22405 [Paenibacillus herberti]